MKNKFVFSILLLTPFLFSCVDQPVDQQDDYKERTELVIPTVNVQSLDINLPQKPTYNTGAINSDDDYDYIDIYELSDFHGAVNYSTDSYGNIKDIGLSKLATYLKLERENNPGGSIVISGGDMYQGSCESNLTRGYLVNYAMNYMGFDAMTLGNHEFDWGVDWIRNNSNLKYLSSDPIPLLCANLIDKTTNEMPDFVKSSTVVTRGNHKIGIIGTIGYNLESSILKTVISDYKFAFEKDIVKNEAQRLRSEEGCDIIIWSSHSSVESEVYYHLTKSDGIDIVFGGHSHTLYTYQDTTKTDGLTYTQTSPNGESVVNVGLKINKTTNEVEINYVNEVVGNMFGELENNSDIDSIMNQYNVEIDKVKNIKLGYTKYDLTRNITGKLKNLTVDAMQEAAYKFINGYGSEYGINKNDFAAAFHNLSGGLRDDIRKGDITYGNVYSAFPFDNELVLYQINGITLKENLKTADLCMWHTAPSLESIEDSKLYWVCNNDYIALRSKKEEDLIRTGMIIRDEIAKYIYERNELNYSRYTDSCFDNFVSII